MPEKETLAEKKAIYDALAEKCQRFDKDARALIRKAELANRSGLSTREQQLEALKAAKLAAGVAYRAARDEADAKAKSDAAITARNAAAKAERDAKARADAKAKAKSDRQSAEQADALRKAESMLKD